MYYGRRLATAACGGWYQRRLVPRVLTSRATLHSSVCRQTRATVVHLRGRLFALFYPDTKSNRVCFAAAFPFLCWVGGPQTPKLSRKCALHFGAFELAAPCKACLVYHKTPLLCGTTLFAGASTQRSVLCSLATTVAIHQPVHASSRGSRSPLFAPACGLSAKTRHWCGGFSRSACVCRPHAKGCGCCRGLAFARVGWCCRVAFFLHPPAPPRWRGALLKSIAFSSATVFNNPKSVKKC